MTSAVAERPTAEASIAAMVGEQYSGAASAALVDSEAQQEVSKFEFDADFQTKLATYVMRDLDFMRKVGHLVKPDYFENVGEAAMVNIAMRFFKQYNTVPSRVAAQQYLREDITAKIIRGDMAPAVREAFMAVFSPTPDLSNGDYFAEELARFARHQAVSNAIYKSVDLLGSKKFEQIEKEIRAAVEVGINTNGEEYDYWERIVQRTQARQDKAAGLLPPTGITTGNIKMDELLYHKGWGRRELSVIMGGPKSGKTTALINYAKAAALAGFNVLYVTLEVASAILSERLDASISDTMIKELGIKIHDVKAKVEALMARAGEFKIHEYPSGTFTPAMLRQLIERYKSPALMPDGTVRPPITFDMICVDYADIMAPDNRVDEARENSKQVWLALRAIAHTENVAMLSATQTNRDGMKSTVATMDTVADDINKVQNR
ncbi:hypothetical protein LP414_27985 [Polaromonas sp. P1(28)-13]|nr:hypothetical protein LP414_27985 [Polaromonas sp. P1(28)-13]